jgi:hypothetical protein
VPIHQSQKNVVGTFRLGVEGLPAAEAGLVRALVVLLAREGEEDAWAFASQGPFDALIVDAQTAASGTRQAAPAVAWLGAEPGAQPDGVHALPRPLRMETLDAWLMQLRGRLGTPLQVQGVATTAAGPRYKLRRWPPQALLRSDPQRVRMATLLSRRALAASELSALSGLAEAACQTFLQLLQSFTLLEVQAPAATAMSAVPARPQGAAVAQSLRKRLGL